MDPFTVAALLTLMNEPVDHQLNADAAVVTIADGGHMNDTLAFPSANIPAFHPHDAIDQQILAVENLLFSGNEASHGPRADLGVGGILPAIGNASLGAVPATVTSQGAVLSGVQGLQRRGETAGLLFLNRGPNLGKDTGSAGLLFLNAGPASIERLGPHHLGGINAAMTQLPAVVGIQGSVPAQSLPIGGVGGAQLPAVLK